MTLRRLLLASALGAAFLFASAGRAQAHDTCVDRIHKEEHKLQRDINKHGYYSRQAQHRREQISRLRSQCGGFRDNRRGRFDRRDRNNWFWDGRRWRRR